MVVRFTTTYMQSLSIAANVVSSNPAHAEVYSKQHYMIKCVSDFRQILWFSSGTPVSSTNKADRHDISEIFLKVASNTITLTLFLLILYNSSKYTKKLY